jgi:uncharacterized protein YdeI (YjbR/CyaY-like superfamily)
MIADMTPRIFRTAAAWRAWLEKNHDQATEIWLAYYKKGTGKKSVTYDEALQEALCFGWIDSIVHKIDEEKYAQRYTPRKNKSVWSAPNKRRIAALIASGRMAAPGAAKIAAAKKNGSWSRLDAVERINRGGDPPRDFLEALGRRPDLKDRWERFPPSQKKMLAWWIESAKRPETRLRRVSAGLALIEKERRFGMESVSKTLDRP